MRTLKVFWHLLWMSYHGWKMMRFIKQEKPLKAVEYHCELSGFHSLKINRLVSRDYRKEEIS